MLHMLRLACLAELLLTTQFASLALQPGDVAPTPNAPSQIDLTGINSIATAGIPGPLAVYGDHAFALVAGKQDDRTLLPVAVAADWNKGRVVAIGHGGMIGGDALNDAGTQAFVQRAIKWLSHDSEKLRVGVLDNARMIDLLAKASIDASALEGNWFEHLDQFTVLVIDSHDLTDAATREHVAKFVKDGGGLLTAGLGWGWLQLNPGKTIQQHPGNLLLNEAGIAWCDGTLDTTAPDTFKVQSLPDTIHAGAAIKYISTEGQLDAANAKQAGATLLSVVQVLKPEHPIFIEASRIAADRGDKCVPTERKPVKETDSLDRLALAVQVELERRTPPSKIVAHPAAIEFPGAVPKDAPRGERVIEVDLTTPEWHSTGLYVTPGEVVTIILGEEGSGCRARIGCHTDTLWHHRDWKRVPDISREFSLKNGKNEVASAFGGLLYIDVPQSKVSNSRKSTPKQSSVSMTIAGAVEAPLFVLGKTTEEQWKTIRNAPAPWGEVASGKIIISVPSAVLRSLEKPAALMEFWDKISDAHATLATIDIQPPRPHRFVPDVQISAGYMHSGYPIMTHLDAVDDMTTLARLKTGPWGLLHELGHNHQESEWTFDGTGEVTCNLFALHAIDTICERESGRGHPGVDKPPSLAAYLKEGADFRMWKRDPFLALHMYVQLEKAFGWETFKKVFAEYRVLPRNEQPTSEDEKRDQWMVRFSRACGKNLGPFFKAWGVPTSEAARKSIANLPEWMPDNWDEETKEAK